LDHKVEVFLGRKRQKMKKSYDERFKFTIFGVESSVQNGDE